MPPRQVIRRPPGPPATTLVQPFSSPLSSIDKRTVLGRSVLVTREARPADWVSIPLGAVPSPPGPACHLAWALLAPTAAVFHHFVSFARAAAQSRRRPALPGYRDLLRNYSRRPPLLPAALETYERRSRPAICHHLSWRRRPPSLSSRRPAPTSGYGCRNLPHWSSRRPGPRPPRRTRWQRPLPVPDNTPAPYAANGRSSAFVPRPRLKNPLAPALLHARRRPSWSQPWTTNPLWTRRLHRPRWPRGLPRPSWRSRTNSLGPTPRS
jgi:hypothetical protein